ncbi:MAG: DUF4199 domain-containing protein [Psychroflexus sp.]
METQDLPITNHAKTFGIIFGAYSILILVLLYLFGYETNTGISLLNLGVTLAIIWYAIHLYQQDNNEMLSLSTAIKLGLAIGVIGGLIYGIYSYFHYEFLQPEMIEEMKATAETEMSREIERQKMSGEEADMMRKSAAIFASPFMFGTIALVSILVKTFIFGLIIGLIKRNK